MNYNWNDLIGDSIAAFTLGAILYTVVLMLFSMWEYWL